jgi:RNA polymerase sigma-70 factor (ECF subfamily)
LALMMVRCDHVEARTRDAAARDAMVPVADLEMAYLKHRYRGDFERALQDALLTVTSRERTLLRLNLADGITVASLGKMYGVSQSTASRWLAQARDTIAAELCRLLKERLHLSPTEIESLAGAVASQIDLSLSQSSPAL